jgi:hypothetical protein
VKQSRYKYHASEAGKHVIAAYRFRRTLKSYGLTVLDYDRMFRNQAGCCAICKKHVSQQKRRLSVDHNHVTGKVRALLCDNCNGGIGKLMDDPDLVLKAYEYLKEFTD